MTKNAKYILKIINSSSDHLTAEQIYLCLKERNKAVALATVYNSLSFLHKEGLIKKISIEGCPDRYDNTKRHDHMICKKCGKLSDITLENLTGRLQEQTDIYIISYDLKIIYICDDCLAKEDKA